MHEDYIACNENWLHTAAHPSLQINKVPFPYLLIYLFSWNLEEVIFQSVSLSQNSLKLISRLREGLNAQRAFLPPSHVQPNNQTVFPTAFVLSWKYTQYSLLINHIWKWDTQYSAYLQSIILEATLWAIKITEVKAHIIYKIHRIRYDGMKINIYYNTYFIVIHNNLQK